MRTLPGNPTASPTGSLCRAGRVRAGIIPPIAISRVP